MWRTPFVHTLTDDKQEIWKSSGGLFSIHDAKFKPQHNETTLLLHYCKLYWDENENAEEWMGHLRIYNDSWNNKIVNPIQKTSEIAMLTSIQESRNFYMIRQKKPSKEDVSSPWSVNKRRLQYCSIAHEPQRYPVYGKRCAECRKKQPFPEGLQICHQKAS